MTAPLGLAIVLALLAAPILQAQPATNPAPAPPQAETPKDPLGRETPRGAVLGFMRFAREGNDEAASHT